MRFFTSILTLLILFCNLSAQKVRLVSDINTRPQKSDPYGFLQYNGKVYFEAYDPYHGSELWEVDSSDNLRMVMDIVPGPGSSYPTVLGIFRGNMIFRATEQNSVTSSIWVYNGIGLPVKADDYYHQSFKGLYFWKIFNNRIYFTQATPFPGDSYFWVFDGKSLSHIYKGFTIVNLGDFATLDSTMYFIANGNEIWASNNTDSLYKVTNCDFHGGQHMAEINHSICFFAADTAGNTQLCKFDGVNPPEILTNFQQDKYYWGVKEFCVVDGKLYFTMVGYRNLWVYDGINPVSEVIYDGYNIGNLTEFYNKLFFTTTDSLWVYDGLNPPSSKLAFIGHSGGYIIGVIKGYLYLLLYDGVYPYRINIYKFNESGDLVNTMENVDEFPRFTYYYQGIITSNGYYFNKDELWKFDGENPPAQVGRINKCNESSNPQNLIIFKDNLYFSARADHEDFYKYDGMTPPVLAPGFTGYSEETKNIFLDKLYYTGSCGRTHCSLSSYDGVNLDHSFYSYVVRSKLIEFNNLVYFGTYDWYPQDAYADLMVFGKNDSVAQAPHLNEIKFKSMPDQLIVFNNSIYFTARDSMEVNRLWSYVPDYAPEIMAEVDSPLNFTVYNNRLYFSDIGVSSGRELWAYDGTGFAYQVKDINEGKAGSDPADYKIFKNRLYFIAGDSLHGKELWSVDQNNVTSLVADIFKGVQGSDINNFIEFKDQLYFTARDSTHGNELWRLDTIHPPELISDLFPGDGSSDGGSFTILDNKLYFSGNDGIHGAELWTFDGIHQPKLAADISPGPGSSFPANLTVFKNKICFSANETSVGNELFEFNPDYSEIKVIDTSACGTYTSPSGRYTWSEAGTYHDTIPNFAGYDSAMVINLTIHHVNTAVVSAGFSLQAAYTGAKYQWVDCRANYSSFAGETNQSFTPGLPGTYAVIMNDLGCVDTSECVTFVPTRLPDDKSVQVISLYPNPTSGSFSIDLGRDYSEAMLTITRFDGQVIRKESIKNSREIEMEIEEPAGIYLVKVLIEGRETIFRVVKR